MGTFEAKQLGVYRPGLMSRFHPELPRRSDLPERSVSLIPSKMLWYLESIETGASDHMRTSPGAQWDFNQLIICETGSVQPSFGVGFAPQKLLLWYAAVLGDESKLEVN